MMSASRSVLQCCECCVHTRVFCRRRARFHSQRSCRPHLRQARQEAGLDADLPQMPPLALLVSSPKSLMSHADQLAYHDAWKVDLMPLNLWRNGRRPHANTTFNLQSAHHACDSDKGASQVRPCSSDVIGYVSHRMAQP